MKKLFAAAIMMIAFAGMAMAETGTEKASLTLSTRVWSMYIGGTGSVFYDKPVLQSDIFVLFPGGLYLDVWHSMGLGGGKLSSDFGDEMDYTLGWSGNAGLLDVDAGAIYMDAFEVYKVLDGDVVGSYMEMSRKIVFPNVECEAFTPYVKLSVYAPAEENGPKAGLYLSGGLKYFWEIDSATSVIQKFGLLYDSGAFGTEPAYILQYSYAATWKLSKSILLDCPTMKATRSITRLFERRQGEVVFGGGLSITF